MQPDVLRESSHHDLKLSVVVLVIGLVVFHLGLAALGRGLGRDQHLGTAVEYAKGHIDLLHPIVLGENANGVPTPMGFPIWEAMTAALMKLFGRWYGWGNVVSLLFHLSSLWPLFQIAQRMISARVAWWALFFYLAQPLTFQWGGMASGDSTAASFAVWFVFLSSRMMANGSWAWWLVAAITGCLSATTKPPFFMTAGLAAFFWLLFERRRSKLAWLQLVSVGMVSVLAFCLWNHHANQCYQRAELPCNSVGLGQAAGTMAWWFGDWSSRLNPFSWGRGAWRVSTILLGSIGLIFLPLAGWRLRGAALARLWILAGVCTVLVFTNAVLVHWHYYFIFSPAVALLCARAATEFEPTIWQSLRASLLLRVGGLVAVAGLCVAQGLQAAHLNIYLDRYMDTCGRLINHHSVPTDKLVVWGADMTGPLLRADRPGVLIPKVEVLDDPSTLVRLKGLGYSKLVLMNPSPLLVAMSAAGGSGGFRTVDLPKELPMVAKNWPVVFSSASILIIDIPK